MMQRKQTARTFLPGFIQTRWCFKNKKHCQFLFSPSKNVKHHFTAATLPVGRSHRLHVFSNPGGASGRRLCGICMLLRDSIKNGCWRRGLFRDGWLPWPRARSRPTRRLQLPSFSLLPPSQRSPQKSREKKKRKPRRRRSVSRSHSSYSFHMRRRRTGLFSMRSRKVVIRLLK